VTRFFDSDENETVIEYLKSFLTNKVSYYADDELHHQFQMDWEEYGQLKSKSLVDADGQTLLKRSFVYDDRGNPEKEQLEGALCEKGSTDTALIERKFDDQNRLIQVTSPSGLTTKTAYLEKTSLVSKKIVTDHKNIHTREFTLYNEDHIPITRITDDGTEEELDNLTGVTCRIIQRTTPKAEAPAQNLPEIIEEKALDLKTGEEILLRKTKLHYNPLAKVVKKEIYDSQGILRYTLNYTYDDRGNIVAETDAEKQTKRYTYDTLGNLASQTEPAGKVTKWTYDKGNRPIEVLEKIPSGEKRITRHTYNLKNEKTSTTDIFGGTTNYEYDRFVHLITTTHPDGAKERATYDTFGHISTQTNPLEAVTKKVHNIKGQPLEICWPNGAKETYTYNLDGTLATYTNPEGLTAKHTYDALGRTTSTHYLDPADQVLAEEHYTYNNFHLLSFTNKDGVTTRYEYGLAGRKIGEETEGAKTTYTYDPLGRVASQTEDGHTLLYKRDLLDRIIEERVEDADANLLHVTQYAYDANNNQTKITYPRGTHTYIYDTFNRLTSEKAPTGEEIKITYSEQGLLCKTTTDPLGYKTIETFDAMVRLKKKCVTTPSDDILFLEEYTYDLAGNKILQRGHLYQESTRKKLLDIHRTYDSIGQLLTIHEAIGTPEEKQTSYTYTPSGLLKSITKNDQVVVTYSYDHFGHQTRVTASDGTVDTSYIHTPCGHFKESTNHIDDTTTHYTLDSQGRPLSITLANGLQLENTYDTWGNRTQLRLPHGEAIDYTYGPLHLHQVTYRDHTTTYTYDQSAQLIEKTLDETTRYTYDPTGRQTHLTHPEYTEERTYDPRGDVTNISTSQGSYSFAYDGLRQLTAENNHQYAYDSYHNRTEKDDHTYTTNDIHAITEAGTTTFTHDPNGNPLTKGEITHIYDGLDRLIEVTNGQTKVCYTYDSFDRRMTKTTYRLTDNEWTETRHIRFLWDGQDEIGAYDDNDNPIELRILGNKTLAEQDTLLIQLEETLYKPLHDLAGNVIRLTSLDNNQVISYQYNAFGEETLSPDPNPWRYRSKRVDPETNLIYFGRRYYDPEHGRFLTPDPSPDTDSVNLYAYTFNNPFAFQDLYGLNSTEVPYFDYDKYARNEVNRDYLQTDGFPISTAPSINNLEYSRAYDLGLSEPEDKRIMFVNGILNNYQDAINNSTYVSELSGGYNVHGIYVASHGLHLDFHEASYLKKGVNTNGVKLLHEAWDHYFNNASPTASILVIGHSRAGLTIKNALLCYDKEKRKRIHVLTIASAGYVHSKNCGSVRSYVSKRDIVHWYDWINQIRYYRKITKLNRHPDARPILDHHFQSPTFHQALKEGLNEYQEKGKV